MVNSIVRNFFL